MDPGVRVSVVALVLVGLLAAGCGAEPEPATPRSDARVVTREPVEPTVFLAAWARGDAETLDEVASPLFRAELDRRDGQAADLLWSGSAPQGAPAFVGGVLDGPGFGHYLYLAAPGVWRVDTDPAGGVVWAEKVWRLSGEGSLVTTVGGTPEQPGLLIGIASDATEESYRVASLGKAGLLFYGTDEAGAVVDGVWSYGRPLRGWRASRRNWQAPAPDVGGRGGELGAVYLASLFGA